MSLHLDFLNKNMYRKYPLRGAISGLFNNGVTLPQALLASAEISSTYTFSKIYISKCYINNNYINIVINDYTTDIALGVFSAYVVADLQVLPLASFLSEISGSLTIGLKSAVTSLNGTYQLDKDDGLFEDSIIFCYSPPSVSSLTANTNVAVGKINIVTNNILNTLDLDTETTTLSVINPALIASNNDFTGALDNCLTPIITKINTVTPDDSGNIDIFGILPVSISVGSGEISLTSDLSLDDVCPERVVLSPPDNDSDTYYADLLDTTTPEWQTWPQYT